MTDRLPGLKFLLFGVVCVIAAGWIASVTGNLDRIPFLQDASSYQAVLEEASGLAVGDDVRIAGVDVGRVNSIEIERGDAVVTFEVEPDVSPTTSWQVGARWRNVIGQRFLYLYPNPGGRALVAGDLGPDGAGRLGVEQSIEVADLAAFVANLDPLLQAIDPAAQNKLTTALNEVLLGRDQTIQSLVTNVSELAGTVAGQAPEVRAVIANANSLLAEYNGREDQLTGLIDQLSLVADTLANRNDEVLDAAVDLASVQAQLGDLIEANDAGLIASADNLRRLTDSIGAQRDAFEESVASLRQGLATYMLISRRGEWFNVRGVAIQVQFGSNIVTCQTEGGTSCAFPSSREGSPAPGAEGEAPGGETPPPQGVPELPDPIDPADGGDAPVPTSVSAVELAPERLSALEVAVGVPRLTAHDAEGGDAG